MTKRIVIVIITHAWLLSALAFTQKTSAITPTLVVRQFYELLHQKRYAEGFRLSVYRTAIEGLTADEMQELEPDFERLAASLPPHIETRGEQVSGDTATVFIKLPNEAQAQEVALMKLEGQWVIGDRETQRVINRQGRAASGPDHRARRPRRRDGLSVPRRAGTRSAGHAHLGARQRQHQPAALRRRPLRAGRLERHEIGRAHV